MCPSFGLWFVLFALIAPALLNGGETVGSSSANVSFEEAVPPVRTWKDNTGKFNIDARLVSWDGQVVRLQKPGDPNIIEVPASRLSEADLEWLALESRYRLPRWPSSDELYYEFPGTRIAGAPGLRITLDKTENQIAMGQGKMTFIRNEATLAYRDPKRPGQYIFGGLGFTTLCILEIHEDGTLLTDREGVLAKDEHGASWKSRSVVLDGKKVIAILPVRRDKAE